MDYLSHNIAVNLKRIRILKGMSLDAAAEQTGVSKSMLHQIEHGIHDPVDPEPEGIHRGLRIPELVVDELVHDQAHPGKVRGADTTQQPGLQVQEGGIGLGHVGVPQLLIGGDGPVLAHELQILKDQVHIPHGMGQL